MGSPRALGTSIFPIEPRAGPARATRAPRARRLVHKCRARRREGRRDARRARSPPILPRRFGPRRIDDVLEVEVAGTRLRQLQARDVVASPRAGRGRGGRARSATPGPELGGGERVQIEFVSANPTGPLHVGNGWLGSYGDALARVMSRCGWEVKREFYVNDTGGQIRLLGESLLARRRGDVVPEEGYQGEYVTQLAGEVRRDRMTWSKRAGSPPSGSSRTSGRLSSASTSASTIGTRRPRSKRAVGWPRRSSCSASVASSTNRTVPSGSGPPRFGDSRDRVLVRSNGDATYLAGDIAYHRDKFLVRKFDRVIDVFGADHHGQVASLKAGVAALGVEPRPPGDPARSAGERRRAPHVQAIRPLTSSSTRSSRSSGRTRRRLLSLLELDRSGDDARSRSRDAPVDGESGLLRAVRPRPDRLDRPEACRARASSGSRSTRPSCRSSCTTASSS